jgi:hypothetical protein
MDNQFTLGSGATLKVTIAPFKDANNLKNALLSAAKGMTGLDESIIGAAGLKEMDLGPILNAILNAATSTTVEQAMFDCAIRATYNDVRVNRELFDDQKIGQQAREDYYEIALKIIEVNCTPFFKRVASLYSGFLAKKPAGQK